MLCEEWDERWCIGWDNYTWCRITIVALLLYVASFLQCLFWTDVIACTIYVQYSSRFQPEYSEPIQNCSNKDLMCHEVLVLSKSQDVHNYNSEQFYCCDNLKWFHTILLPIDCRLMMPNMFNLMNFLHVYIFLILYNLFRCKYRAWCLSGILNNFFVWYLIRVSWVLRSWLRSVHVCLKWDQRLIFRFIIEFVNTTNPICISQQFVFHTSNAVLLSLWLYFLITN